MLARLACPCGYVRTVIAPLAVPFALGVARLKPAPCPRCGNTRFTSAEPGRK